MIRTWNITQDGESYTVTAVYTSILGKLTITIGESEYKLPSKFLAGLFGRREKFMLGDKLAVFHQKPFGSAVLITAGGEL